MLIKLEDLKNSLREELIIEVDFIRKYHESLRLNNKGKKGRPFKISQKYIQLLALIRKLYGLSYRELEIFTKCLNKIIGLPFADYAGLRRRIIKSDIDHLIQSCIDLIKLNEDYTIVLTSQDLKILNKPKIKELKFKKIILNLFIDKKLKKIIDIELKIGKII